MRTICHITSAHPRHDIRILIKECVTLANNGYDVSLIVADGLPDENYFSRITITSVLRPDGRFRRMWQTPRAIYSKVLQLSPEIVHFHDPELMLIGLKLAKRGFKVVYDVHEDLPKQVQNKHWLPKMVRPLISSMAALLERYVAKRVIGIVAATPIIAKRFALYNPNVVAICNYPLLSEFVSNKIANWDKLEYRLPRCARNDNFEIPIRRDRLCYIGSISKTRGIIPLVESLAISKITLELAGTLSSDVTLEMLAGITGWEYVNYRGVLNRTEITELLSQVKIGVVTLLPTPSYVEALPIKLFEYMLAGIPVVASNFPLWQDIVAKYDCGVLVDPTSAAAIAKACMDLLHNPDAAKCMGENGYRVVIQHFNWEAESNKLIDFYTAI